MKKILIVIILMFLVVGCKYKSNWKINRRTPPVTVIAIDPDYTSVVLRDGDNKIFTIFNNATTYAISKSLKEGDTVRVNDGKLKKHTKEDFTTGDF